MTGMQPRYHDNVHATIGDVVRKNEQGKLDNPGKFLVTQMDPSSSDVEITKLRGDPTDLQISNDRENVPASELRRIGVAKIRLVAD